MLPVLRIGIDAGEVVHREGDVFGGVVNRASRVCAEARPDTVLLTRAVLDVGRPPVDVTPVSLGPRHLRNLTAPVELFALSKVCEPDRVVDPVYRMSFDRSDAAVSVRIAATEYYFCSTERLRRFLARQQLGGIPTSADDEAGDL